MDTVQSDIIFYAFRYALGRRSYSVSTVVNYIKNNMPLVHDRVKKVMIKEIQEAVAEQRAGDEFIDAPEWTTLRKLLQEELKDD